MSDQSAISREQLLRILALALVAAVVLMIAVGGLVAYSAHVVDQLQVRTETRLAERRVERTLVRLREDVVSATVWDDAYQAMASNDLEWMQVNLGDYYSDYMRHEVTLAYAADGALIYASRDSEPVTPQTEAAFAKAVAPMVLAVRRAGLAKDSGIGLDAVVTREGVVMSGDEPWFVTVSTVVREDVAQAQGEPDPVVVSAMKVISFVPSLTADLGLLAPRMIVGAEPALSPSVPLRDPTGAVLATLTWTPARPGGEQLVGAIPVLIVLLSVVIVALIVGGLRVYRLVTDLALNEQALDRSLLDAETANAAKSQFLANMSHELRTPLNGIIAMTELLRADQSDARSRQMADTIVASGRVLESVVNDILDVSKIEAGQLKFEVTSFDLAQTLANVADLHAAAAASKSVKLQVDIRDEVAGLYAGDRNRVSQVVSNLLSNAVKFTEEGCVRLSARVTHRGVRVAVSDTGIGFDRATADRLFQRFEQADVSVSRRFGGTGLGLSICASLVQMMGGAITVRSIPGKGSTFIAYLPLQRVGDAPAVKPETRAIPSDERADPDRAVRILFADDHEVNRKVVTMILQPLGVDLVQVENGAQALDAAKTSAFDIILMDVQMPVMDGLTATREIRAWEAARGGERTPIISLTANAMPDDIARSMDAGSDLHLAKPIRPDALIEAIQGLLSADTPMDLSAVAA